MRHSFSLIMLFFLFTTGVSTTNAEPVDLTKITTAPTRPSRAPMLIPVTASVFDTELQLNFTTTVGTSIITITDQTGATVYYDIVDTATTSDLSIVLDSGDYTLTVSYGSITLRGTFSIL